MEGFLEGLDREGDGERETEMGTIELFGFFSPKQPKLPSQFGAIIGLQFFKPYPVDLAFTTDAPGVKSGRLAVTDINGTVVFKEGSTSWNLKPQVKKVVTDASGNPLVSMKEKFGSTHRRWQVFAGDSLDPTDLLFNVKWSPAFHLTYELEVFLASNTEEEVCDYKIKGKYDEKSSTVYKGDSSMVVAQMSKEHKVTEVSLGKHAYGVSISPNTDSCFITALIMILHEMDLQAKNVAATNAAAAGAAFTSSAAADAAIASSAAAAGGSGASCSY